MNEQRWKSSMSVNPLFNDKIRSRNSLREDAWKMVSPWNKMIHILVNDQLQCMKMWAENNSWIRIEMRATKKKHFAICWALAKYDKKRLWFQPWIQLKNLKHMKQKWLRWRTIEDQRTYCSKSEQKFTNLVSINIDSIWRYCTVTSVKGQNFEEEKKQIKNCYHTKVPGDKNGPDGALTENIMKGTPSKAIAREPSLLQRAPLHCQGCPFALASLKCKNKIIIIFIKITLTKSFSPKYSNVSVFQNHDMM